ncbi:MAG: hypothetical protein R3D03_01575 [Geminicoccaceae bacterium]
MTIPDADGVAIISNTLSGFPVRNAIGLAPAHSAKVSDNIISDVLPAVSKSALRPFAEITGNIISNAGRGVMTGTQSDFTLVANNTIKRHGYQDSERRQQAVDDNQKAIRSAMPAKPA